MRVLVRRSNAKTWLVECNTDYCLSVRLLSHCLLCLIVKLIKGDFSFFCWYVMHLRLFFRSTVVSNLTNINLKGHFLTMWASSLLKESTAASKVVQTRSEEHLQSETHVLQLMSEAQDADGQKRLCTGSFMSAMSGFWLSTHQPEKICVSKCYKWVVLLNMFAFFIIWSC